MILVRINPKKNMRLTSCVCGAVLMGVFIVVSSPSAGTSTFEVGSPQQDEAERPGWSKFDAGPFSIFAPSGWEFHRLRGVDSYVGEFVGDGIVLGFDFGRYSNRLDEEKDTAYIITHKVIGGHRARIVIPRTAGHGLTGVYFRNIRDANSLTLFGHDLTPTQQELALKIFSTVQFGVPVPQHVLPSSPAAKVH